MADLLCQLDLEDVWRRRNPNTKRYSYFKPNSKIASRIDFWFCSKTLDPDILQTKMVQAVKSDHHLLCVKVKTTDTVRGPRLWKMNNTVLNSDLFENLFKTFYQTWKKKLITFNSKKEWWEVLKLKVQDYCVYA